MKISLSNVSIKNNDSIDNFTSEIWQKAITFSSNNNILIKATSGKGKSSLISFIYGIRRDYKGEIKYDNQNIKNISTNTWTKYRNTTISIVFQGLKLFSTLTALENVLIKNNLTHYKTENEILHLFSELDLLEHKNIPARLLSFGQQQRVAIIRALCQPFSFLLLDEPFSHLDVEITKRICKIIEQEIAEQNAGLILTSLDEKYYFNYNNIYTL